MPFLGTLYLLMPTKIVSIYPIPDLGWQAKERVGSIRIASGGHDLPSAWLDN
jgi:hypothetical protein